MEPEEIDNLFRNKLADRPVLPSPEAWMRLQQKMEPPKKERTMWIYYAAASVAILLISGILYFKNGTDPAGPAVATAPTVVTPVPAGQDNQAGKVPAEIQEPAALTAQVPVNTPATRIGSHKPAGKAGALERSVSRQEPQRDRPVSSPALAAAPQPAPAANLAVVPNPQPEPVRNPAAGTAPAPALAMVEVVVQRYAHASFGEDLSLRENLNRKGNLLKNIYKQARNLKNGDPVELATLGVDKGRIQEETKELKQKISNVISL